MDLGDGDLTRGVRSFLVYTKLVTGKSLDSPENGNVDKMSEKCRKNVRKMSKNCPEGLKTQFSDIFWTIFAYLVDAFVW